MKLPFSYKRDYFGVALMVSMLGHVSYAAISGDFLMASPGFSVEQAPSSMEVVILEAARIEKPDVAETVLTIEEGALTAPIVKQVDRKAQPEQEIKSVFIPEKKGAAEEATPKYFKNPTPEYPDYARRQGWEGTVLLEVSVDRDGRVTELYVLKTSGFQILDDAAVKTIQKWIFEPARIGGITLSSKVKIPIRFVLNDEESK